MIVTKKNEYLCYRINTRIPGSSYCITTIMDIENRKVDFNNNDRHLYPLPYYFAAGRRSALVVIQIPLPLSTVHVHHIIQGMPKGYVM